MNRLMQQSEHQSQCHLLQNRALTVQYASHPSSTMTMTMTILRIHLSPLEVIDLSFLAPPSILMLAPDIVGVYIAMQLVGGEAQYHDTALAHSHTTHPIERQIFANRREERRMRVRALSC